MFLLADRLRRASLATRRRLRAAYGKVHNFASFAHMVALVKADLRVWARLHPLAERLRRRREERRARRHYGTRFHAKTITSSTGPRMKLILLLRKKRIMQRLK